jgi:hypothetical protein
VFLSGSCGMDRSSTINERPDSVILGQLAVPQGGRRGRDRMVVNSAYSEITSMTL